MLAGCSGVTGAGTAAAGSSGATLPLTDPLVNRPGMENRKAMTKKIIAAAIVIFANTVCVPRGPKAVELAPPPPKTPEASDLLGCNNTKMISKKQEIIKRVNKM